MTRRSAVAEPGSPASAQLARGISATWWYTFGAILFFEVILVLLWVGTFVGSGLDAPVAVTAAACGLVWGAATVPLLHSYRHRADDAPADRRRYAAVFVLLAVAAGVAAGVLSGSWLIGALPAAQSLMLLPWPAGVRLRLVLGSTAALAALCFLDIRFATFDVLGSSGLLLPIYAVLLPVMTVSSLWWWDVLVALDRARASEARLAATQERLRVATDVHDLQGHHLQVIALQLELVERLLTRDTAEAATHLQTARRSVDDARQGTRDLALRFRSVPLRDEIANAADLLRAAGATVEASIDPDADLAPAEVLGPVIRETTTNVLRHGGGHWARLALVRAGASWRYEVANDVQDANDARDAGEDVDGSGLEGIRRRIAEAGGTLEVRRERQAFLVAVIVPTGRAAR